MAVTLTLNHVWFHDPIDLADNLKIPWTESDEGLSIPLEQKVNVAGYTRVRRQPGQRNAYNYSFKGLDEATLKLLKARAGKLQYLRDSRGVAAFGMFGDQPVRRWRFPRLADIDITFFETSSQFVREFVSVA